MGKLKYLETMLRNTNDSNAIESYLTSMTAMVEATSKDIKTAKCFSTVKNLQNSKSGLVGARARYLIKMWKRQEEEEKEMEDDDVDEEEVQMEKEVEPVEQDDEVEEFAPQAESSRVDMDQEKSKPKGSRIACDFCGKNLSIKSMHKHIMYKHQVVSGTKRKADGGVELRNTRMRGM